jgi:heme exporter protein B
MQRTWAVVAKDLRSEIRTRYGITALLLFVVTTVTLVVFALADEPIPNPLAAALLWVIMLFTAMLGLGRGFMSEEERGTALFLRLNSTALAVYAGKLLMNVIMAVVGNVLGMALLLGFVANLSVGSLSLLLLVVIAGSIGLASVLTIVSALVAKTGARSPILPVLSFPILVPLLLLGTKATLMAFAGFSIAEAASDVVLMCVYNGLVVVVSALVFEVIWND